MITAYRAVRFLQHIFISKLSISLPVKVARRICERRLCLPIDRQSAEAGDAGTRRCSNEMDASSMERLATKVLLMRSCRGTLEQVERK